MHNEQFLRHINEYSISSLKKYTMQQVSDLKLDSPTLCHGISGILLQYYSLYKETRICHFENMYKYLLDEVIKSADYSYKYLYYDFDFLFNNNNLSDFPCKQKHHGILRGSSGVLLTLYSMFIDEIDIWAKVFCFII